MRVVFHTASALPTCLPQRMAEDALAIAFEATMLAASLMACNSQDMWVVASVLLFATFMDAPFARAEDTTPAEQATSGTAVQRSTAPSSPEHGKIRRSQFNAFVNLVGEQDEEVLRHLHADSELIPLAAAAADARLRRERLGKSMTSLGFTVFGAGLTVGAILYLLSGPAPGVCEGSECQDWHMSEGTQAAALMSLVVAGLGLGTGLLGIFTLADLTDIERSAADRYHRAPTPPFPAQPYGHTKRAAFGVPLLHLSF